jgi:hypothetical protein
VKGAVHRLVHQAIALDGTRRYFPLSAWIDADEFIISFRPFDLQLQLHMTAHINLD